MLFNKEKYSVDVFALCYNEEHILQKFIDHYKDNFNANITFYDNESSDSSTNIMVDNNCNFVSYYTGGKFDEISQLAIKNQCWKQSTADFVIVCDVDEFLEVNCNIENCTLIKTIGFDMIGNLDSRMGVYNSLYSKYIMFSPKHIKEINYNAGCHTCNPIGSIVENTLPATLLHRKYISEKHIIKRYNNFSKRNSEANRQSGYCLHYDIESNKQIYDMFEEMRKNAIYI